MAEFTGTPTFGTAPLSVAFTDRSTGSIDAWQWNFGDGSGSNLANPTHIYATAGTYTVALRATGPGGSNVRTRTEYVVVTEAPPVAEFTGTPTSGAAPLDVAFTDQSTGTVTSREWDFGDGSGSSLANPTHVYEAPGTYAVALNAGGPGGSNTLTRTDYIVVSEPAPVAEFIGTPTFGPAPLSVAFTDQSAGAVTAWEWDFGDGSGSSLANPTHVYEALGTYTVALNASGPGGSNTLTRTDYIVVSVAPVAEFICTPTFGTAPLSVAFTDQSAGAVTAWAWEFGDGSGSTLANPTHVYETASTYTVTLTATGPGGSSVRTRADSIVVIEPAPNILMIVLDDVGMDMFGGTFQEVPDAPATPEIDRLATDGVFFRNAWANPYCSPTRATLMTGRYSFRTGIGTFIDPATDTWGLQISETTLPERLHDADYYTAACGKWHLGVRSVFGPGQGLVHPLASGFDSYQGALNNPSSWPIEYNPTGCSGPFDYDNWVKTTNGVQHCTQTYMTTDNVEDALAFLQAPPDPWFLYLSFSAVHSPMHDPTGLLPPNATQRAKCKAMMEVLDAGIGRVLLAAAYPNPNLYVIVVGDNGTEYWVSYGAPNQTGCFGMQHAKGSLYEGGVNVPLIISGPGIVARETSVIVNTTDLYATVCDLAGVSSEAEDSRSLMGVLLGSDAPVRDFVFAEQFTPNGLPFDPTMHERAVCDGRYKLIRRTVDLETNDELFDLQADPCEDHDLLPVAEGSQEDLARRALESQLVALGVD